MAFKPRIVFHVGGPAFHPVAEQAAMISHWLGEEYHCRICHDGEAFGQLEDCGLLVLMGLFWTGSAEWGGPAYRPLKAGEKLALENFISLGMPIVVHHGAIASYNDWPRFGELLGFTWRWDATTHSPVGTYDCRVLTTGHPVVAGVGDYRLEDELYYNIQINDGLIPQVHAVAAWDGQDRPMAMTANGGAGRGEGAGKVVYLANGHDMRAFKCQALRQIWINSVQWALEG